MIFTEWYLPGYKAGGPIRSCSSFVEKFKNDFEISIVTSNCDWGEKTPYENIRPDSWLNLYSGVRIIYLSKKSIKLSFIKRVLNSKDYDFIYLNSMYSFYFSIFPLIFSGLSGKFRNVVLAPRGMLTIGSLSVKSRKKIVFLYIFKFLQLHKKVTFHATNIGERNDIIRVFGENTKVALINNIIQEPKPLEIRTQKERKDVKLISVTRISPVKNILYLLDLFKGIESPITLSIYGTINDSAYYELCVSNVSNIPKNVKVNMMGAVSHQQIEEKLKDAHFFILPTLGENFGYAIYESMASGTPVIISDKTPWRELEERKAGWDIPLEQKNKFVEVINKCAAMDQEEYNEWSQGAYNYAKQFYENNDTNESYKNLFFNNNNSKTSNY